MADRLTDPQIEKAKRLVWPHLPTLIRVARYFAHDPNDADDLVQETVMKALRFIDQLAEGSDPRAWALTILRRTFIDRHRAERRFRLQTSLDSAPEPEAAERPAPGMFDDQWSEPEELMQQFDDEQVIQALQSLPAEIRWTLLLVDVEQLDQSEAAEILDVPLGTIKSRAHRGRQMLRDHLAALARERGWIRPAEESSHDTRHEH